jgi:hypothetical protein
MLFVPDSHCARMKTYFQHEPHPLHPSNPNPRRLHSALNPAISLPSTQQPKKPQLCEYLWPASLHAASDLLAPPLQLHLSAKALVTRHARAIMLGNEIRIAVICERECELEGSLDDEVGRMRTFGYNRWVIVSG